MRPHCSLSFRCDIKNDSFFFLNSYVFLIYIYKSYTGLAVPTKITDDELVGYASLVAEGTSLK